MPKGIYKRTKFHINILKKNGKGNLGVKKKIKVRPDKAIEARIKKDAKIKKYINSRGYVIIRTKEGWKAEHGVKMEKKIGRKLRKGEVVHHIDRNRRNNKITNLQLFSSSGKHLSIGHNSVFGVNKNYEMHKM